MRRATTSEKRLSNLKVPKELLCIILHNKKNVGATRRPAGDCNPYICSDARSQMVDAVVSLPRFKRAAYSGPIIVLY